jgi:hypothetical protein
MSNLMLAIMIILFLGQPAHAQMVLHGRIEHSDSLPPVDASLRPGVAIDTTKLKALTPNNLWYRIPAWAAGTWHFEKQTNYFHYTYQTNDKLYLQDTFMARSDETRGWQKDFQGQIWEYCYNNYITETERNDAWSYHLVKYFEPLDVSEQSMTLKFVSTGILVDKTYQIIRCSSQTEAIQVYTPCAPGLIKVQLSIKSFDEEGKPIRMAKGLCYQMRVAPFSPWNVYRGKNMRALFAEYLQTHGMTNLIPADSRLATSP